MSAIIPNHFKNKVMNHLLKNCNEHNQVEGKKLERASAIFGDRFENALKLLTSEKLIRVSYADIKTLHYVTLLPKSFNFISLRRILWTNRIISFFIGLLTGILTAVGAAFLVNYFGI